MVVQRGVCVQRGRLAPTFACGLAILAERLELHAPMCAGPSSCSCHPVRDLEKFVRAAVLRHVGSGARKAGALTGLVDISPTDIEDMVVDLVGMTLVHRAVPALWKEVDALRVEANRLEDRVARLEKVTIRREGEKP